MVSLKIAGCRSSSDPLEKFYEEKHTKKPARALNSWCLDKLAVLPRENEAEEPYLLPQMNCCFKWSDESDDARCSFHCTDDPDQACWFSSGSGGRVAEQEAYQECVVEAQKTMEHKLRKKERKAFNKTHRLLHHFPVFDREDLRFSPTEEED